MASPVFSSAYPKGGAMALLALLLTACGEEPTQSTPPEEETAAHTVTTEEGPIVANVSLRPEQPRVGDRLQLELAVTAKPDVDVEMPAFGDALGRFAIVDFRPLVETLEDGSTVYTQAYRLEAPFSGRHRIPRLRLEYIDDREGEAERRELLTDELPFEVESVTPEGTVVESLLPMRGELEEYIAPTWYVAGGIVLVSALAVGGFLLMRMRRRAEVIDPETAYERALRRLSDLEIGGLPEEDAIDDWYVELSDIVRRYIEDRFALRAPELTTEEFLTVARSAVDLDQEHRVLLESFLSRCDAVKFARYRPELGESREALDIARRFLHETAPYEEEEEEWDEEELDEEQPDQGRELNEALQGEPEREEEPTPEQESMSEHEQESTPGPEQAVEREQEVERRPEQERP